MSSFAVQMWLLRDSETLDGTCAFVGDLPPGYERLGTVGTSGGRPALLVREHRRRAAQDWLIANGTEIENAGCRVVSWGW